MTNQSPSTTDRLLRALFVASAVGVWIGRPDGGYTAGLSGLGDAAPVLLDFGAVHRTDMSRQFQPKSVITPGFSPIEQYEHKGYIGPWTDIYAIGATMRSCIEGNSPPDAKLRREQDSMRPAAVAFKRKYSQELLNAIDWAMEIDPTLRPQKIDQFFEALNQCALTAEENKSGGMFNRLVSNLWK